MSISTITNKDNLVEIPNNPSDAYQIGYAIGYQDGKCDAASPWHRVEEPPKDSKPVMCWEKQGFPYVDRYFPKYGFEFANSVLAEPIYWMPIEPPKEDE